MLLRLSFTQFDTSRVVRAVPVTFRRAITSFVPSMRLASLGRSETSRLARLVSFDTSRAVRAVKYFMPVRSVMLACVSVKVIDVTAAISESLKYPSLLVSNVAT